VDQFFDNWFDHFFRHCVVVVAVDVAITELVVDAASVRTIEGADSSIMVRVDVAVRPFWS
jgi:hypothetical protein